MLFQDYESKLQALQRQVEMSSLPSSMGGSSYSLCDSDVDMASVEGTGKVVLRLHKPPVGFTLLKKLIFVFFEIALQELPD